MLIRDLKSELVVRDAPAQSLGYVISVLFTCDLTLPSARKTSSFMPGIRKSREISAICIYISLFFAAMQIIINNQFRSSTR